MSVISTSSKNPQTPLVTLGTVCNRLLFCKLKSTFFLFALPQTKASKKMSTDQTDSKHRLHLKILTKSEMVTFTINIL